MLQLAAIGGASTGIPGIIAANMKLSTDIVMPMPAIELSTVTPDAAADELIPLLDLCRNLRVLGLGETTHGTSEAFRLKHRIFRALAEAGTLRTIAFECGLAAGRLIDDYVRKGRGNALAALHAQGYWTWSNQETLAMIQWLRTHNAARPPEQQIAFYGIDVQRIDSGLDELSSHLRQLQVQPAQEELRTEAMELVTALKAGTLEQGSPTAIAAAPILFEAAELLPSFWPKALCLNAARYVEAYLGASESFLMRRDEFMADTLLAITKERAGLTAIWAHNEHVATNPDHFGSPALGHWLHRAMGENYLALGMMFGKGTFLARSWHDRQITEFHMQEPSPEHFEQHFVGTAQGIYRTTNITNAHMKRYRRYLGALYGEDANSEDPDTFRVKRPLTDFDLVAWLPETTAADYIPESY